MKFYIVIANVNGTVLRSRYKNRDSAFARASSYKAQGHRAIIKIVENGEILN